MARTCTEMGEKLEAKLQDAAQPAHTDLTVLDNEM